MDTRKENKYSLFSYAADLAHFQQHLGLGADDENGMTFRELAVRLNFNGHSAAEKAYKQAVETLKEALRSKEYKKYLRARRDITKAERTLRPY